MTDNLPFVPAAELAVRIRTGEVSPVEVVDAYFERIHRRNERTNAYVALVEDEARERARRAERAIDGGECRGPLHGVPVAIKDEAFLAGVENTFGSVPFEDFVPDRDMVFVERLIEAGAIPLGKTNMPEFGIKGVTDNRLFGPTSTPFDPDRNAGGSSGGSAAAVGDALAPLAQGADGGGSLRIPASFCGIYTIKPSYGRVPHDNRPNAFASHTPFIHPGPLARTVEDAALMLDVMAGQHPHDPMSLPDADGSYREAIHRPVDGYDIAYSQDLGVFPVSDAVLGVVDDAAVAFEDAGSTLEEVEIDIDHSHRRLAEVWTDYVAVMFGAAAEEFRRDLGIDLFGEHRAELTDEFRRLLDSSRDISAVEYKRFDNVRTDVYEAIRAVFEEYDLLVAPTLAVPPVENTAEGQTTGPSTIDGEEVDPQIGWCMTYPINFTGHPAASVPAGLTAEGLPVGMQIVGPRFADGDVLAASAAFERLRPWRERYPWR